MDGLSLLEQARAVRRFDVIIAPHGAQNTNILFSAPCTVFVELFPLHLFLTVHQDLASEVGALAFFMYPSHRDDMDEAINGTLRDTAYNWRPLKQARERSLYVPASHVLDALDELEAAHRTCVSQSRLPAHATATSAETLPTAFDGVPTVGGSAWLGARHPMHNYSTEKPSCTFCHAAAGCCDHQRGVSVDPRRLFSCRRCY